MNILPLTKTHFSKAHETLLAAFAKDPVHEWCYRGAKNPELCRKTFVKLLVKTSIAEGTSQITEDGKSVAIWYRPGRSMGTHSLIRYGALWLPLQIGLKPFSKLLQVSGWSEAINKKLMGKEKHFYLFAVGTDPTSQGQGLGSKILQKTLDQADAEGFPCYLDSSNEKNNPFYEKLGFITFHKFQLPENGPVVTYMKRPVPLNVRLTPWPFSTAGRTASSPR